MTAEKKPEARTFVVESRFQKMARRPGGVTREEAIGRAQSTIEEQEPTFSDWLEGELNALVSLTRMATSGGFRDTQWVETANGHCRQIRDVGTTMGFQMLTFVANNLCEIFEAVNAGADYRGDLVELHIEALMLARQERYRNMRPDQLPELSAGLRRVVERASQAPDEKVPSKT